MKRSVFILIAIIFLSCKKEKEDIRISQKQKVFYFCEPENSRIQIIEKSPVYCKISLDGDTLGFESVSGDEYYDTNTTLLFTGDTLKKATIQPNLEYKISVYLKE